MKMLDSKMKCIPNLKLNKVNKENLREELKKRSCLLTLNYQFNLMRLRNGLLDRLKSKVKI